MNGKEVVERMKRTLSVTTDADLATRLKVPFGTINTWKKRSVVPFAVIDAFSEEYHLSLDWLVRGEAGRDFDRKGVMIETRAFELGVRMALEASGMGKLEVQRIIDSAQFMRNVVYAQVEVRANQPGVTTEDVLDEQERVLDRIAPRR